MSKIAIAIEGFVANDLSVRDVTGGHRVVDVNIPHTPQKRDDQGQWVDDGETVWTRASFWNEHADALLMSVEKGMLVSVTGTGVEPRAWESNGKAGVTLTIVNPTISVLVRRPKRGQQVTRSPQRAESTDPWATPAPEPYEATGWPSTETPF